MRRFLPQTDVMSDPTQLLGVSNAIVDVLAHVDHEFLEQIGAEPGSMTLIDKDRAKEVYGMMGPATEMSGGSVANTIAGFANLGGSAAYIGKVRNDQLGRIFNHDMRALGVDIRLPRADGGAPTARSHVLITEDGQRTMQPYLGACLELGLADITSDTVVTSTAVPPIRVRDIERFMASISLGCVAVGSPPRCRRQHSAGAPLTSARDG